MPLRSRCPLCFARLCSWEWSAYPVRAEDTPSDMKGYGNGARLANNDAKYKELFPSIRKHMVEEGLTLNRHYAASVCTPSRKQLLTGRSVATQNNGVRASRLALLHCFCALTAARLVCV